MFWNKENNSLLTISVSRSDSRSLQCRTTSLAYVGSSNHCLSFARHDLTLGSDIAANRPDLTRGLFIGESLEWPGFVELDEINRKIITHSTSDR